jgi:inhibitor of cysteine peptidase
MKTDTFKNIKAGILLVFLLFSLVLASCARPQPDLPKEVSISWSELDQSVGLAVGDILEVVLPANPSTGYAWEAGFYNQSVLKPYGEPEFWSITKEELGAKEWQTLHFEAIGEGETELDLAYRRSFENEEGDQQIFQVYVIVKEAID